MVEPHRLWNSPIVIADSVVHTEFGIDDGIGVKRLFTKEKAIESGSERPYINGLGDFGARVRRVIPICVFVYDFWGQKGRRTGPLAEIRILEEDGISGVIGSSTSTGCRESLRVREVGDAEISNFDVTTVCRPQQIGRFDITVDYSLEVN